MSESNDLVPRTPPRSRRKSAIVTPRTPKFGSFYDYTPQRENAKHNPVAANDNLDTSNTRTPITKLDPNRHELAFDTPSIFNTEAITPRKRTFLSTPRQTPQNARIQKLHTPRLKPPVFKFANDLHEDAHEDVSSTAEEPHPHQPTPPNVPGMYYVFRGKKLFRPFKEGEKPIEPVTLFKNELQSLGEVDSEYDTECDTEIE